MALDPNRFTLKTQEAVGQATSLAESQHHPEVTPDHLLAALLGQADGLALPLLAKAGVEVTPLTNALSDRLAKLPKAYGGQPVALSRPAHQLLEAADGLRRDMGDE